MSFFESLRKCTSFHWNVNYVSDGSYYYVKTIFQHVCRNGIQITWFWRWAQNKLFNFIFWRTFKNGHFGSNFCFLHLWNILYFSWKFGTDSFNFIHKIPREMITKWFYWCEFWQSRRWNSMHLVYLKFCLASGWNLIRDQIFVNRPTDVYTHFKNDCIRA